MSDDDFEALCASHDWEGICREAHRARAAEEHLKKAVAAQFRTACEEAERASAILVAKDREIKTVVAERDAALARLADLGQLVAVIPAKGAA